MRRYLLLYRFLIVNIVGGGPSRARRRAGVDRAHRRGGPHGPRLRHLRRLRGGPRALRIPPVSRRAQPSTGLEEGGTVDLPSVWTSGALVRPEFRAEALKARLFSRIAVVRQIAAALVVLGLIGTVAGFIIALSGVSAEDAGTLAAVQPMISTLISGMSVALYTTLEGAILGLWLTVNYRMLATGTATLYSELLAADGRV